MNEVAKLQHCILLRGGLEVWVDDEKVEMVVGLLESQKFIRLDGVLFNTSEVVGIYPPDRMEDYKRHKQGQWKCQKGTWHDRGEKCTCRKVIGVRKGFVPDHDNGGMKEISIPIYEDEKNGDEKEPQKIGDVIASKLKI